MKKLFLVGVALFSIISTYAQSPRIYRSEFLTFDKREDAKAGKRAETAGYEDFKPERIAIAGGEIRFLQKIYIDATRNDYNTFFHLENFHTSDMPYGCHIVICCPLDIFQHRLLSGRF